MAAFTVGDVPYPARTPDGQPIIDWAREVNGTTDCPHGWKSVTSFGNVTWEDCRVNVYAGVCDRSDQCGVNACQYFDSSRAATRLFIAASVFFNHTAEGLLHRLSWQARAS